MMTLRAREWTERNPLQGGGYIIWSSDDTCCGWLNIPKHKKRRADSLLCPCEVDAYPDGHQVSICDIMNNDSPGRRDKHHLEPNIKTIATTKHSLHTRDWKQTKPKIQNRFSSTKTSTCSVSGLVWPVKPQSQATPVWEIFHFQTIPNK